MPKFIPINFSHARARIRNFSGSTELCPNNLPRCLFCITLLAKLIYIICNIPAPNPPFLSFLSSLKISFPSTTYRTSGGGVRLKGIIFMTLFLCVFFLSCLYITVSSINLLFADNVFGSLLSVSEHFPQEINDNY